MKQVFNYELYLNQEVVTNIWIDLKHLLMDQGKELKEIKEIKANINSVKFINGNMAPVNYDMNEIGNDDLIYLEKYFKVNDIAIGVCITQEYETFAFEIYNNMAVKSVSLTVEIEYE